jgi:hypothetical protein
VRDANKHHVTLHAADCDSQILVAGGRFNFAGHLGNPVHAENVAKYGLTKYNPTASAEDKKSREGAATSLTASEFDYRPAWQSLTNTRMGLFNHDGIAEVTCAAEDYEMNSLLLGGLFQAVSETGQSSYGGVALWVDGDLRRLGDGVLSASDEALHTSSSTEMVYAVAIGNEGRFFAGGHFSKKVWDLKKYVYLANIAMYQPKRDAWLPLGDLVHSSSSFAAVTSLKWDAVSGTLFIGGSFDTINGQPCTPGLALWRLDTGLTSMPGGGLVGGGINTAVKFFSLDYKRSDTVTSNTAEHGQLYIAGHFLGVGRSYDNGATSTGCRYPPPSSSSPLSHLGNAQNFSEK